MIGRRIAARQPPPTCLPELRRALLDEWCNIPKDQIDNLILSMPRRLSVVPIHNMTVFLHSVGHGSKEVKVTWLACFEFEPRAAEDPPCREGRCALNPSRRKRPPIDMVGKLRERVPAQMSSSSLDHVSKLRGPSPTALVQLYSVMLISMQ
ncbi:kinesin-like protein [Trichonephila clavipes]|nr:kinesin-like protein [Trichonephila clavipes]